MRQASRLAYNQSLLSASLRKIPRISQVATVPLQTASRRTYVSETKRDSAQVSDPKIETAIRLDRKELEKSGLALGGQQDSNMSVSPMAGKCAKATIVKIVQSC